MREPILRLGIRSGDARTIDGGRAFCGRFRGKREGRQHEASCAEQHQGERGAAGGLRHGSCAIGLDVPECRAAQAMARVVRAMVDFQGRRHIIGWLGTTGRETIEWDSATTVTSTRWARSPGAISRGEPGRAARRGTRAHGGAEPQLNAVIHLMEGARVTRSPPAFGRPVQGVPFLVKDLMTAFAGEPMRGGSRLFRDYVPTEDEELTRRYKRAGLVIFGKTNTPELGLTNVTERSCSARRATRGTSSARRAARAVDRLPRWPRASCPRQMQTTEAVDPHAGVELRARWPEAEPGRNPTGPFEADIWFGLIGEHVVTRTVRDSAALLDATAGDYPSS